MHADLCGSVVGQHLVGSLKVQLYYAKRFVLSKESFLK